MLYHLAISAEWDDAVARGGPYERSTIGRGLDEVGFVHCSFEHQVGATHERFYAARDDVVLLSIDPDRLVAPLRVEDLTSAGEAFPHLYGPLELDAVIEVQSLPSTPVPPEPPPPGFLGARPSPGERPRSAG